jgi:hypothetical protein
MSTADRIINRRGRKHFRRSYSLTEVRMGLLCLLGLAAVAAWVAHRGANPDPALFANTPNMLDPGQTPAERGPLPTELARSGWQEGRLSTFDGSNL